MYDGEVMSTEQHTGAAAQTAAKAASGPAAEAVSGATVPAGRHDPEGRRRQIVRAAAELIPEVGLAKLTHRLVAQRAGVSLGSTTRYFANLDELRRAGLTEMSELLEEDLASTRALLEAKGCTPESLTEDLAEFLAQHELVRISIELIVAANADPALRPLANHWADGIVAMLSPALGPVVARGIVLIMDGATMHASVNEQSLSEELLREIFATMLSGARGTQSSAPQSRKP